MGRAKDEMMEIEERGYGHSDKLVSAFDFGEPYIQDYIRKNGEYGHSSFSKSTYQRKVLSLEDLMPVIMGYINTYYERAVDTAPWDSEEKRYTATTYDPYDFVHDELNDALQCESSELLTELVNILSFDERVSAFEFSPRQEELDMQQWDRYCELVKSCDLPVETIVSLCKPENLGTASKYKKSGIVKPPTQPTEIHEIAATLEKVMSYIRKFSMTDIIYGISSKYSATPIYRVINYLDYGVHPYKLAYTPARSIGTAPGNKSAAGRMNETGDMMFYGAFDKEIAKAEVGVNSSHPDYPATIGTFRTNKMFRVIDLSKIAKWKRPSIFDIEYRDERSMWMFLDEFRKRISEPVLIDENDPVFAGLDPDKKKAAIDRKRALEYKPTQVFTKYIQRNTDFKGIEYRSAKAPESANKDIMADYTRKYNSVVLFVTNQNCLDEWESTNSDCNQLVMEKNPVQEAF